MPIQRELMNIKAFLEVYGISRNRFYSEVKLGALHITKLGVRTYVKRTDAEKWMDQIGGNF